MSDVRENKKLSVTGIVMMIFSVVFGFGNTGVAFFRMGYASIIWYAFGALVLFLPLMFISAEYAVSFKEAGGGIYTWMRRSRGELYGFMGTFMWYFSIVIWMVGVCGRIWIPISSLFFGEDQSQIWSILGLKGTQLLGVLGIILIICITYFASKGFNKVSAVAKIGGIACTLINILLFVVSLTVLVLNKGFFEEPIKGASSFLTSPNESHTIITLIGFITFAIFAYGGIEGLGSLVEKAKSAKTFSKACIVATFVIAVGYCVGIFLWGVSCSYSQINAEGVNMGNATYLLMNNLGYKLGLGLGFSTEAALNLGKTFMRFVGLTMLLGFAGALFTLIYSPIKSLLDGAPKKMWPEFLMKKNKADMPANAMWIQTLIVCVLFGLISFLGTAAKSFYEILQLLSNVTQCATYIFIIASFPAFRRNESFNHDYTIIKSKSSAIVISTISYIIISLATIFTIIEPVLDKNNKDGTFQTLTMLISTTVFLLLSVVIFNSYKKRVSKDETISNNDIINDFS